MIVAIKFKSEKEAVKYNTLSTSSLVNATNDYRTAS